MKREAKELGLKPVDVFLVSAGRGQGIREVIDAIEHYRNGKDVYVVGCTNVGKSTFINRIIKEVSGEEDIITTSQFPGTTLMRLKSRWMTVHRFMIHRELSTTIKWRIMSIKRT